MSGADGRDPGVEGQEVAQDVAEVVREYTSQADYVSRVSARADTRSNEIRTALRAAFASAIHVEECEVIDFQALNAIELGNAIAAYPIVLKPLLAACNVAGRALERDLDLRNIDT